jgi:hypothetical protein
MTTATAERKVPRKAMQFDSALPLQFAEQSGETSVYPISMLGRSAEPIYHWWWGKVVHDMAGFSTSHPKVAIDYRHDDEQPIGYLDQFRADNTGLHLSGKLVSLDTVNDRVTQLKKLADAGVPFQSSIYFESSKLEQVADGASAEVNGYTVDGPAIIVRQWSLRGMAVCLYGADGRTNSQFSDSDSEVSIPFITSDAMTKKLTSKVAAQAAAKKLSTKAPKSGKLPPASALKLAEKDKQADDQDEMEEDEEETESETSEESTEDETADGDDSADDSAETTDESETETESEDDDEEKASKHSARKEIKKYIEAFGHKNGANWFAEGLDFTSAMSKHCQELSAQLSDKDAEIADLRKKLKAVDRGEQEPLKLSSADRQTSASKQKTSHLGEGVAKFAAGLKLPGKV